MSDQIFARLDAVEIKVTAAARQVQHARDTLGLRDHGRERHWLYFCEDLTGAYSALPLLDSGLILRLRHRDDGPDDSTVKLRPCRRSRLTPLWTGMRDDGDEQFRVEADWSGDRKVLTASLVARPGQHGVAGVLTDRQPLRHMFTVRQRQFLHECADIAVRLDALTPLGPISVYRWSHLRVDGFTVTAEQWGLGNPADDLLELSIRVEPDGAEIAQLGFEAVLRQRGIDPEQATQETKTRHFLHILAQSAGQSPT